MELLELKQRIHNKIEVSDKKVLEAIYTLLENINAKGFELTDEEATEIEKDVSDYLSGKSKGYIKEDIKKNIRKTA